MKKVGCLLIALFFIILFWGAGSSSQHGSTYVGLGFISLLLGFFLYVLGAIGNHYKSRRKQSVAVSIEESNESDDDRLNDWKKADRIYLKADDARNKTEQSLLSAAERNRKLQIRYNGGSEPGELRHIIPRHLFRVKGYRSTYLVAYDYRDKDERTFKVSQIDMQ
jgi:predicted DNA-binding transcriptional regulator YafY